MPDAAVGAGGLRGSGLWALVSGTDWIKNPNRADDSTIRSMSEDNIISRRELLKRVGGAGVAVPVGMLLPAAASGAAQAPADRVREPLENLTLAESETLDAIASRLIPTDASGPGAVEARAARYIDRALGGALASFPEAYRSGLAGVDRAAQASKGAPFAKLTPEDQDAVLRGMEESPFFNLVLGHTIQGTFCDPYYGGNANFAGWDLIGYPGVRLAVRADEQRLDARPEPTHMSAYDYTMFSGRKPERASADGKGGRRGD